MDEVKVKVVGTKVVKSLLETLFDAVVKSCMSEWGYCRLYVHDQSYLSARFRGSL